MPERFEEQLWYNEWRQALDRVITASMTRDRATLGTPERQAADQGYERALAAFREFASQVRLAKGRASDPALSCCSSVGRERHGENSLSSSPIRSPLAASWRCEARDPHDPRRHSPRSRCPPVFPLVVAQ
jgi:hypothetical protein